MFTIDKIRAAHSLVKSGADFPAYVQALIKLGVIRYETFVEDGHTDYYGTDNFNISSASNYKSLVVAGAGNIEEFKTSLKAHQQGKTDYPAFCMDCGETGVVKWVVSMDKMTCAYFDKSGIQMLVEKIPEL